MTWAPAIALFFMVVGILALIGLVGLYWRSIISAATFVVRKIAPLPKPKVYNPAPKGGQTPFKPMSREEYNDNLWWTGE